MDLVNAIAKVRFSSAKPQRVQLHRGDAAIAELLCMEPGQKLATDAGERMYYVITGEAAVTADDETKKLPPGQFVAFAPDHPHTIANPGEQRVICLMLTAGR